MYNYTPQATHHAKFDFDPKTWVVWANSQFATVLMSFFFFSLIFSARLQVAPADDRHRSTLSRHVLRQECALWVTIFNFQSFAYFHQKSSKLTPK